MNPLVYWYKKNLDNKIVSFRDSWSGIFVLSIPDNSWSRWHHFLPVSTTRMYTFAYRPNSLFDE
jgi:hypothetical protein